MKIPLQASLATLLLLPVSGCVFDDLPACGNEEIRSLVMEIVKEQYPYKHVSNDAAYQQRVDELSEEVWTLDDVVTHRAATREAPIALCRGTVAITAFEVGSDPEAMRRFAQSAADDVLSKPLDTSRYPLPIGRDGQPIDDQSVIQSRLQQASINAGDEAARSYSNDVANLVQLERQGKALELSYSAAYTDDGRPAVELEVLRTTLVR